MIKRGSVKVLWALIIILTFGSLVSSSQESLPSEQWKKTYEVTDKNWAVFVQQTSDNGYILAGTTFSYSTGADDAWLIKTDSNGNQQWSKTFGGTNSDGANSVQQTSDGGFILAGVTMSDRTRGTDAWLIKTDANGNQQWNKTLGGMKDDMVLFVQQTSDGGYILAGRTFSYGSGGDAWLIKIDSNGNQQWSKTFGGSNFEAVSSVQQTSDGGYILAGLTIPGIVIDSFQYTFDGRYSFTGTGSPGNTDVLLIKTDSNGTQKWSKTFGGTMADNANSVQQTSDGGFILAGATFSYGAGGGDVWLIKTDSSGNQQWNKTFGGPKQDWGNSVQQTSDGGYIIASGTLSYGAGAGDAWLIKTDSNGNHQWNMTFGGQKDDVARSVQQTLDRGYIFAGGTGSYGAGDTDAWLIKVSSEVLPTQTPTPAATLSGTQTVGPIQTPAAAETKIVSPTEKTSGFEIVLAITVFLLAKMIKRKRNI